MIRAVLAEIPPPSILSEPPLRSNEGRASFSPTRRPATLRDIAQRLGVSHVTVSLALRGSPGISDVRRTQIKKTARRMGYCPNPVASALSRQRQNLGKRSTGATTIAWIHLEKKPTDPYRQRELDLYREGAYEASQRYGFRLEEFTCPEQLHPYKLERTLKNAKVRGILLPPHRREDLPAGWNQTDWSKFSTIGLGCSVTSPSAHAVMSHDVASGELALENILNLGYRRVGFVSGKSPCSLFRAGFMVKQADLPENLHIPSFQLPEAGTLEALASWLKEHRPEAILTETGELHGMLVQLGHRVPEDSALASTCVLDGKIDAGIRQNYQEMGKAAVDMLAAHLQHHHLGIPKVPRKVHITGQWTHGSMLPARKKNL